MNMRSLFVILFALFSLAVHQEMTAQERDEHLAPDKTIIPADARYEILRATLTPKFEILHVYLTLKLDKYTGKVYRLDEKEEGTQVWEQIVRLDHKLDKVPNANKVNYQIYNAGDFKSLYLLNINTGASWVLLEDKEKNVSYWNPIE